MRARVCACKTRVRGEEIISSLERGRENERKRERADASSSGMHPRGSASRPPAVLFNPFLFSPRALQRLFEFRVLPPFSSHRVETGSDPGMETRRERIFRNTRSDFNVGESETVRSFSKSNFFRKDEDRFDKNVPGPWMRRIGGKGGGRGGVFFSRRVEEARKTLAHSFERDV